MYKLLA